MGDPRWFSLAEEEKDTSEVAGDEDNPRIIEYLKSVSWPKEFKLHDEISWCSAFVNFCMLSAGETGTNSAAARSWLRWGQHLKNPRFGCVVVMRRGTGWQGHVGFWIGTKGKNMVVLGGNQGNKVCIASFPESSLLGYRWPNDKLDIPLK